MAWITYIRSIKNLRRRLPAVLLGNLLIGVAAALLKFAALGLDPNTSFITGMAAECGLSYGNTLVIENIITILLVFIFERKYLGIGTIANMLVGYPVDFILWMFGRLGIDRPESLILRLIIIAFSIVLMSVAAALHLSGNLGMPAYDALGYIVERGLKYRVQFRAIRVTQDLLFTACGFVLGILHGNQWQMVNVGTVGLAVCMGPIIQFCRTRWFDPIMTGGNER